MASTLGEVFSRMAWVFPVSSGKAGVSPAGFKGSRRFDSQAENASPVARARRELALQRLASLQALDVVGHERIPAIQQDRGDADVRCGAHWSARSGKDGGTDFPVWGTGTRHRARRPSGPTLLQRPAQGLLVDHFARADNARIAPTSARAAARRGPGVFVERTAHHQRSRAAGCHPTVRRASIHRRDHRACQCG